MRSKSLALTATAAALTLALTGCGGGTSSPPTVTVHDTPTVQLSSPPAAGPSATPPEATAPSSSAGSVDTWTMPNLIGKDLQTAQDAIQSLTNNKVWYSGSTDLTGKGRQQIMDRNWQVCTSTPAPGETFTTSTAVSFGVVKIGTETCP